jgi:hypothetical protein
MNNESPFLDVKSFAAEEASPVAQESSVPLRSPFLAIYEFAGEGRVDKQTEEYFEFLNELYDDHFNEVLSNLVDEAAGLSQTNFANEQSDPRTVGYQAERLLTQHFAPLVAETESLFQKIAEELDKRDIDTLSEDEVEAIVDGYHPPAGFSPNFEEFLDGLKKWAKKTWNKGVALAKKAGSTLAKWGLKPLLAKLKTFAWQIIKQVIAKAIDKVPEQYRPIAKLLAAKLGISTEGDKNEEGKTQTPGISEVGEIQNEFNQHVANLLFAQTEVEQELEVANSVNQLAAPQTYPVAELEAARERFIQGLMQLKEGEDPTPQIENFLPALQAVGQIVIPIIGRPTVVRKLAEPIAYLIRRFVGPQYAPALSTAIADIGLRLLKLETSPENETREAASAVASTVEETVQRIAALPEYILDNQELLEGAVLEAFEQAAAANLPPVLSEQTYRQRPELRDLHHGFWRHCRRYKKRFGPKIMARISPYKLSSLETFDGSTVGEALEEQYAIAPGEELEAEVHLYEAVPGTRLSDIARGEEVINRVDGESGHAVLHPLTHDAAALLLDQSELGRDAEGETGDPTAPQVGQRFYYLEIPGKRPLMVPTPGSRAHVRHRSRLRLRFDFAKNEIVVRIYLSEFRSQQIAVELRRSGHVGMIVQRLRPFIQRRIDRTFSHAGKLKIIHGAVIPSQAWSALSRLPSVVLQDLRGRLIEWIMKALTNNIQKHAQEFIRAAEDTKDGITMVLTLENSPGFRQLGEALKGKGIAPASLKIPEGEPTVQLKIYPGRKHE